MKLFIFGSNGMLGNYAKTYLSKYYQVVPLTRKDYDLQTLTINSLRQLLHQKGLHEGDVVVNCAGVIPQSGKQIDLNRRMYFTINSLFPIVLSMICKELRVKMIHITTDCVYDGFNGGNYDENDAPTENSDYGLSKSLGDLSDCTVIRTSIIGEETNNKRSLVEWVKSNEGKEIDGYINHHWNGVTCLQLSKIIREIIENNLYWEGIRHIFSPKSVSKYELLVMINDIYELDITINEKETQAVDKTITSIHDNIFDIPDLRDQIKDMKIFCLSGNNFEKYLKD